jgi:hypothetical protein
MKAKKKMEKVGYLYMILVHYLFLVYFFLFVVLFCFAVAA